LTHKKQLSWEYIAQMARSNHARVAIGIGSRHADAIHLAESAHSQGFAEVLLVSEEEQDSTLEQVICNNPPAKLVELLVNEDVQGVVRGSLPSSECMENIKSGFNMEGVQRAAILQTTSAESMFMLAPVGVDEGLTASSIVEAGRQAAGILTRIGIAPKVGVLSSGRKEDRERHPLIGTSIDESESICENIGKSGIPCENCQILIENAVKSCNVILAPNGVMGNLIFRSLCLLGGGIGFGAPVLNIPAVYVDTSRVSFAYERALATASMLL